MILFGKDDLRSELINRGATNDSLGAIDKEINLIGEVVCMININHDEFLLGVSLRSLPKETYDLFDLFRVRPVLNLLVNDEECVPLDEWLIFLLKLSKLLLNRSELEGYLMRRYELVNSLASSLCKDFSALKEAITEDASYHGLTIELSVANGSRLKVKILRNGKLAQGCLWRKWAEKLEEIVFCSGGG